MNVNGEPLINTNKVEESSDEESSSQCSEAEERPSDRSVSVVQHASDNSAGDKVNSSHVKHKRDRKRKRSDGERSELPTTSLTVDAARELIKKTKKRSVKPNRPTEPVLAITNGKLSRDIQYGDERGKLFEFGHDLDSHEFEVACYVLESKWLPGQPKKGSTYGGKTFEFPALFFGIDEKATNVLKSLAVLLGTNDTPKKAASYSGSHYAYVLIGAAVCPDASPFYKDAVKAFGGDMMIRTLIKELYAGNERICAIVDCTHAQKQSSCNDANKLLDMISQGYKPKVGGYKYATKPDFFDSD